MRGMKNRPLIVVLSLLLSMAMAATGAAVEKRAKSADDGEATSGASAAVEADAPSTPEAAGASGASGEVEIQTETATPSVADESAPTPETGTPAPGDEAASASATSDASAVGASTETAGDSADAAVKADATVAKSTGATVADQKADAKGQGKVAVAPEAIAVPVPVGNFMAKGVPRTDRIVNVLTAQTVRPGAMTLTVDHRAYKSFWSGEDAWFDYLGLDSGNLKIGIGLRVGLKEYMDVGFYRLSNGRDLFDVYEFDTKMRFLSQDYAFINASLRVGGTWFVQQNAPDAAGFLGQVNIDRRLFGTLLIGTGFAFHTDSSNDEKYYGDQDPSAAVLGYLEWRPIRRFSLNGEMAAAVAGYKSKYPNFAFSTRFLTHRHSFALVVSNTQYMSADGIVTNSWRGFGHMVFGFQIVREFQLVNPR